MTEITQYYPYIAKKTMRIVRGRSDKDDILQEVLIALTVNYPKFDRSRGSFTAWADFYIFGTVTEHFKKLGRKKRRIEKDLFEKPKKTKDDNTILKDRATPSAIASAREIQRIVEKEIYSMRGSIHEVARRVILEDQDREIIQEALFISNKCLNATLSTARQHLRNAIDLATR